MPLPVEAVGARRVRRRHPVLLVGLVQRMAADPGAPAAVDPLHERVLDAGPLVAGEDRARVGVREAGRVVGLEHVDPPVLAVRRRAAGVEAPAAALGADERGPLHRHRAEPRLVQRCHGRAAARRRPSGPRRSRRPLRASRLRGAGRRSPRCRPRRGLRSRSRSRIPPPVPERLDRDDGRSAAGKRETCHCRGSNSARGRAGALAARSTVDRVVPERNGALCATAQAAVHLDVVDLPTPEVEAADVAVALQLEHPELFAAGEGGEHGARLVAGRDDRTLEKLRLTSARVTTTRSYPRTG